MKVKSEREKCLTLHDPMNCSLPGSSIHGIFQARVPEWGAIAFSELIVWFSVSHFLLQAFVRMKKIYIELTSSF